MKKPFITIIAVIFLISCSEKPKETSVPEQMIEKFFGSYLENGPQKALSSLLPTNKYIPVRDVDSVALKLQRLTQSLGDFQGYEKIRESTYGTGIAHFTYIVKYSRQPLRFNFKFYEPGNGWRIQNFSYEAEFLDELDETAAPSRLKENYEVDWK